MSEPSSSHRGTVTESERELGPFDEGGREWVKRRKEEGKEISSQRSVLLNLKGNSPGTA